MNRRTSLIGLLAVVASAALLAWFFYTFKQVDKTVDLPMRGPARYNGLFALQRTLEAQKIPVTSRSSLHLSALVRDTDATLILAADVRTLTAAQVLNLLDWVEDGGHLVFALPPSAEGRAGELLDHLGLSVLKRYSCLEWKAPTPSAAGRHCFRYRFTLSSEDAEQFEWLWGSAEKGFLFGRRNWGEGSWLVAANLEFLHNRELNDKGHAALAWQVLGPTLTAGKVHLVYATRVRPWYVLLLRQGWPVLLPLLIALAAWLWARSQRFGPLLPAQPAHRRALLEHVQAAGEFAYRRGRGVALYAALRRAFLQQLRRRDPLLAALDGEALVQALATQRQLPLAAVRQALQPVDLGRPEQFLATIRTLLQLRSKP